MEALLAEYGRKKSRIKRRIKDFKKIWKGSDKEIFAELCFCICTPQSKAVSCDAAIKGLTSSGELFRGGFDEIRAGLKAVRFPNNKARYILKARELFGGPGKIKIKDRIDPDDILATRHWLVKNVKGIGLKEAGHFLRNIGFGETLAILDVHILRNMVKYRVIKEMPVSVSEKKYIELEKKLMGFSKKIGISLGELDLVLWSSATGHIFK